MQAVDSHGLGVGRTATTAVWFGMESVERGGSVGAGESSCRSSACGRRAGRSVVLKIRVSVVRSAPGHHFQ